MATLLQHLREFNRKERFYLIGMALGNKAFCLSIEFRRTLGEKLGLQVPADAFAAMDYHLDWLAASLYLAANPETLPPYVLDRQLITATQEDIDLLVVYESAGWCHVVMVEAKGVTGYKNSQFSSKVKRLAAISKILWESARARPYFILASPRHPQRLDTKECPDWMVGPRGQVPWMYLSLPETLKKVVRCNSGGTSSERGDYWKVDIERYRKMTNPMP
jgi:hypothetical protein